MIPVYSRESAVKLGVNNTCKKTYGVCKKNVINKNIYGARLMPDMLSHDYFGTNIYPVSPSVAGSLPTFTLQTVNLPILALGGCFRVLILDPGCNVM